MTLSKIGWETVLSFLKKLEDQDPDLLEVSRSKRDKYNVGDRMISTAFVSTLSVSKKRILLDMLDLAGKIPLARWLAGTKKS